MKGHDGIIKMRLSGKTPGLVFLNDYPCQSAPDTVEIGPMEAPESLDLRFLVGLRVSVAGSTEKRAKGLFEACKRHRAKTVAACHVFQVPSEWNNIIYRTGWTEIWTS